LLPGVGTINLLQAQASHSKRPWSFARVIGMYTVGRWYGTVLSCLPSEAAAAALEPLKTLVQDIPNLQYMVDIHILAGLLGMSIGIYLVGTAGHVRGSFALTLLGALVGQLLRLGLVPGWDTSDPEDQLQLGEEAGLAGWNMFCALIGFYYSSEYDPAAIDPSLRAQQPRQSTCARFMWVFGLAAAFWASVSAHATRRCL